MGNPNSKGRPPRPGGPLRPMSIRLEPDVRHRIGILAAREGRLPAKMAALLIEEAIRARTAKGETP